eukprot:gene4335-6639_t
MYGRNRGGGGGGRGGRGRLGGGNFRGNGGWKQPRESGENIQGQRAHHIIQSHSKNEFAKKKRELHKRATVNHFSSIIQHIEDRSVQPADIITPSLQPHTAFAPYMRPPTSLPMNPANAITKDCILRLKPKGDASNSIAWCCEWTPDGRRLISGHSTGHLLMWYTSTFHFETIVTVGTGVRCMRWNRDGTWMLTGDDNGSIKYWQVTIKNVCEFQPHKQPVRQIDFSPTSNKFCTCSDDTTVRVFDFETFNEERTLSGHGADVRSVAWHPTLSLIASGSHDNQQPLKLWDPRASENLATLYNVHRDSVMDIKWNANGHWLLTASRDSLIKLVDIRMMKEVHVYRAHQKEVNSLAWHPIHEQLFVSGGANGDVFFWMQGSETPVGDLEKAHDSHIWDVSWHPLGHILSTSSNDQSMKCWARNLPGDDLLYSEMPENLLTEEAKEHRRKRMEALVEGMVTDDQFITRGSILNTSIGGNLPGLGQATTSTYLPGLN